MLKKCWVVVVLAALAAIPSIGFPPPASAERPKTYFDYLERAWAVGEIQTRNFLKFRDGLVRVYPGTITDLTYGRLGKAQSVMLVDEVSSADAPSLLPLSTPFYAPIYVLPRHSYWRDNLPNTPNHEIPGGRRYLFVGDEIAPVKSLTKRYTDTFAMDMPEKRMRQQALLVESLESPIKVIREDALRRLDTFPVPAKFYDDATKKALATYAAGNAPADDRATVVGVIARAGMKSLTPDLEKLSTRNDIVGGAALAALGQLGEQVPVDRLLTLADSDTFEIQVFAVSGLGGVAGQDPVALEKVVEILDSNASAELRSAAGTALGKSGSAEAVPPLERALWRGDGASRGAALGLADLATPESIAVLKKGIVEGQSETQLASVLALGRVPRSSCADCRAFLLEQRTSHKDKTIRDLIAIVLELPAKHEH